MTSEELLIEKIVDRLRVDSVKADYTTETLAELLGRNKYELSRIAEKIHGHYMLGKFHMFNREEIDFRRRMGMNLIKE